MAWRTNADFYPLLHEQNKMNIWISGCLFGNLFNSAICLLFIYFPTKVFKKINKTGVEVIETPKLNKECFSFVAGRDSLLDIYGAATTLVLGAAPAPSSVSGTVQGWLQGSHCPKV